MIKGDTILCVSCGNDTKGFSMRSVFMICRDCVVDVSGDKEVDDYLKSVDDYIEERGTLWISEKLYNILCGVKMDDKFILLNNNLFKDAISKIYGKPFNMIESDYLKIILREKTINEILK
tara:strand:- start:124 stop:483 length:360 start_codon:yes stop_codon:yes gene_type:complete